MKKLNRTHKANQTEKIRQLPGGSFSGGCQTTTLPGGGFHHRRTAAMLPGGGFSGGRQTTTLPGGGFHYRRSTAVSPQADSITGISLKHRAKQTHMEEGQTKILPCGVPNTSGRRFLRKSK